MIFEAIWLTIGWGIVLGALACTVINVLKGKWFIGILSVPLFAFVVPAVAAKGPARPESWWARHRYEPSRIAELHRRFAPRSRRRLTLEIVGALFVWLLVIGGSGAVE